MGRFRLELHLKICPSGLERRMSDGAVHLEQEVLPREPVRRWVCSTP